MNRLSLIARFACVALWFGLLISVSGGVYAQKKKASKSKPITEVPVNELTRLRDEYVKATKDYKASLQKLLALYQDSAKKAADRRDQMQKLFTQGLVSKHEAEMAENAVTEANLKITGVEQ